MHGTCPLCGVRKARRECPALGRMICAVCCGTKRLVEIPCPDSCPYLASAREHPAAVVQRRQERDLRFFLPLVSDLTEPQARLVLVFQAVMLRHAAGAVPALLDQDVADAAGAVAATLETARKGVIYEHQAASIPAQRLSAELRAALASLAPEASHVARVERDGAVALRTIEQAARTAATALAGDEPPIFINLARRLAPEPGTTTPGQGGAAKGGGSPLIITG
jgi:hypothetical protein